MNKCKYIDKHMYKCLYIYVFVEYVPPLSSLRLLVSPLRLTSAFMWQVVKDQNVEQFGKLEEFVSVMTNLVPELLSRRQRATLIVGLRAKVRSVYTVCVTVFMEVCFFYCSFHFDFIYLLIKPK